MRNQVFIHDDFNPTDIAFSTLLTMSKSVLETMLPAKEGTVQSTDHHEGIAITNYKYFITSYI